MESKFCDSIIQSDVLKELKETVSLLDQLIELENKLKERGLIVKTYLKWQKAEK